MGHFSSGSKNKQTESEGVAESQGAEQHAAGAASPHAQGPQKWWASDTPLPSSKTRRWALVSLTVTVWSLKGLISSKKPSHMSPRITDPISPCSSVRLCFHSPAHHSLQVLHTEAWEFLGGKDWVVFILFSEGVPLLSALWTIVI